MANDIIDRLLRIQEQDLGIVEREREIARLPDRIKKIDDGLQTYRAAISDAEEQRKAAQLKVKQTELDVEEQRQKMARLREQQLTLKTNREFRAMEDEVGAIEAKIGRLETMLLEEMEAADAADRKCRAGKKELEAAVQRSGGEKAALEEQASKTQQELKQLRQQRESAASTIPGQWLSDYTRLFNGKKDHVLVAVENGICGGCHMKLPPAVTHSVRRTETLVTCDFCGRMLYSAGRMI